MPGVREALPSLVPPRQALQRASRQRATVNAPECPRRFYTERKLQQHTSASHGTNDSMMVVDRTVKPNGDEGVRYVFVSFVEVEHQNT